MSGEHATLAPVPNRVLAWAFPLIFTVLAYGLAAGIWKHAALTVGQFCVLFVLAKTPVNWGSWIAFSRKSPFERSARRFLYWALAGQVLNGFAWIFYFTALGSGPAAIVQTVTAGYTAFAALLALIFLKEKLIAVQLFGIAVAVAAGMMLGYVGDTSAGTEGLGWFVASLLTIFFWGAAVAVFKHAYNQPNADDHRFFLANWVGMVVTVLPYGLWASGGEPWVTDAIGLGLVIVLLYSLGDLALFAAIARGPASIVSPLSGLYPIPTIAYAALVLSEPIAGIQWIAIAMVLVAIVLIVPERDNPVLRLFRGSKGVA